MIQAAVVAGVVRKTTETAVLPFGACTRLSAQDKVGWTIKLTTTKLTKAVFRITTMYSHPETDTPCYSQTESYTAMDLDDLLPIERQMLEIDGDTMADYEPIDVDFHVPCDNFEPVRVASSVTFDDVEQIAYVITPISEMSKEEKNATWYTGSDLERFKQTARKLCKDKSLLTSEDSIRGMECYFPSRQKAHKQALDKILRTCMFCDDDDLVAQVAEECSLHARKVARAAGVHDFYAAYFPHMIQKTREASPDVSLRAPNAGKRTFQEYQKL